MKTPNIVALLSHSTNRLLLLLVCFLPLSYRAAEPAANLPGVFAGTTACGDAARSTALNQNILAVIQKEVTRRTAPDTVTVERQDVEIQTCPSPAMMDSEFVIKEAEYDAARDVTVFRLASSQAKSVLPPLIVTVHKQRSVKVMVAKRDVRNGQAVSMNDFAEATQSSGNVLLPSGPLWGAISNSVNPGQTVKGPATNVRSKPVLLVKIGIPSELIVSGRNFKGRMTVIPLQSGAQGDELRVRDPGTRKVLRARVTSANQLEEIF